jgi:DNA-binding transcriptional LysR family regulator
MDIEALLDLKAVYEANSFTRAAARRGISQPALTRRIQVLEAECKLELLVRSRGKLELTAAGRRMMKFADEVTKQYVDITHELTSLRDEQADVLVVAALHSLSTGIFPKWLKSVSDSLGYSNAEFPVSVTSESIHSCIDMMKLGTAHLMMSYDSALAPAVLPHDEDLPKLEYTVIAEDLLMPVCCGTEKSWRGYQKRIDKGEPVPYLAYTASTYLRRLVDLHIDELGLGEVMVPTKFSAMSQVLRNLARQDMGVAWVLSSLLIDDSPGLPLHVLKMKGEPDGIPVEIRLYRTAARSSGVAESVWQAAQKLPRMPLEGPGVGFIGTP